MATGKRLGRGLEALLGGIGHFSEPEPVSGSFDTHSFEAGDNVDHADKVDSIDKANINKIDMSLIDINPFQPRRIFDETELEQLAQSIQNQGLLSPIAVRQTGSRYQIIAGERRFRATMRLGWYEIPAQVFEVNDQQMAELALTENIQRKDLNAIEKAASFAQYLETYGCTHEELAKRLEINRSTVSNLIRLLALPKSLQDAVCQETITQGHVRALLSLPEWEQIEIAAKIQEEGWSVRETERFVQELTQTGCAAFPQKGKGNSSGWNIVDSDGNTRPVSSLHDPQSEHIQQIEGELRHALGGLKVKLIQTSEKGKGKLVISFAHHDEFEHLYHAICRSDRAAG